MAEIAVVSQDAAFVASARDVLGPSGHRLVDFDSLWDLLPALRRGVPALVVVDVLMPHVEGWEICKHLLTSARVPVLVCDKDDDRAEWQARVEALLQCSRPSAEAEPRLVVVGDDLCLDVRRGAAIVRGQTVNLTPTEFRLLACLVERPGRVWSYDELLVRVWGEGYRGERHLLHVYVSALRRKVEGDARRPCYILTCRGKGYYLASGEGACEG